MALLLLILWVVHHNSSWFITDKISGNPYKLVYAVLKHAVFNSKPISRSAFTYCDDEVPSRIDFGKQKYGGPFTTEQVEDVKVFLRIMLVIGGLSPVFMLQWEASMSLAAQMNKSNIKNNIGEELFVKYGFISPLFCLISIPAYSFVLKPFFSKYLPNMFKTIGISIVITCFCFLHLFAYNNANIKDIRLREEILKACNNTLSLDKKYLIIPPQYIMTIQHILIQLQSMMLYIPLWEFICSQSPQNMKGFIFGSLYAFKSIFQLFVVSMVMPNIEKWKSAYVSCQSAYYLANIGIGIFTLVVYTIVSRRYRYRKRNDICNIYQYAEDYYSNIH